MKIICGLGNPGSEYQDHRHNVGFMVVDELARALKVGGFGRKFDAEVAQASAGGEKLLLLKPETFMNLSGEAVTAATRFYKLELADVLVVHDELDLPFGKLQLKQGGGHGGHNGLRSISGLFGEDAYGRLRFGIGKPEGPNAKERVSGFVLSSFSKEERPGLPELLTHAVEGCLSWATSGMGKAMNGFNRR